MINSESLWSAASLSVDGAEHPVEIKAERGLSGFAAVYVNNVCDMLGIKHYFSGYVDPQGEFNGQLTEDAEPSTLVLIYRHLATQGNIKEGKLDMSEISSEWLESLPYILVDDHFDVSNKEDNIVLMMLASKLKLGDIDASPEIFQMPSHQNDDDMRVMP